MAGTLNHLKQAIQNRVVPLLIERGFHLYSRESGIEAWTTIVAHMTEKVADEFVALLPQVDAWFKVGTLGPNLNLTIIPLKFAE